MLEKHLRQQKRQASYRLPFEHSDQQHLDNPTSLRATVVYAMAAHSPFLFPLSLFSRLYTSLTTEPTDAALPVPRGNAEQYNYSHFSPRMQNQHEAPSPARLLKKRAFMFQCSCAQQVAFLDVMKR